MAPSLMVAAGELDPIRLGHPASCGTSQPAESSITDAYKPRPAEEDPAKTWNPDPRAYYRRKVQQQAVASVPVPLPQGFPEAVDGKCSLVWSGQELTENEYVSQLRPEDINEIEAALKHFKGKLALTLII